MTDRYRKPEDLPAALPVFPLRGVILLPRSTLPLMVFEPRYLTMIDDVLRGDRMFGVVQPDRRVGEAESPLGKEFPLRGVGCAGRLTAFTEMPDLRLHITVTGIGRFEIAGEQATDLPYRVCEVDYRRFARDLVGGAGEEEVARERLLDVLKTYLNANRLTADWDSIDRSSNELVVNTLAMISPYGPEEKQALLEAQDLSARAEVLMTLAEMDLAAHDDGSGTTMQ